MRNDEECHGFSEVIGFNRSLALGGRHSGVCLLQLIFWTDGSGDGFLDFSVRLKPDLLDWAGGAGRMPSIR